MSTPPNERWRYPARRAPAPVRGQGRRAVPAPRAFRAGDQHMLVHRPAQHRRGQGDARLARRFGAQGHQGGASAASASARRSAAGEQRGRVHVLAHAQQQHRQRQMRRNTFGQRRPARLRARAYRRAAAPAPPPPCPAAAARTSRCSTAGCPRAPSVRRSASRPRWPSPDRPPTACRTPAPAWCRPAPTATPALAAQRLPQLAPASYWAQATGTGLAVGYSRHRSSISGSPASGARRGASASAHPRGPLVPAS
jgi:hypothetical protein